MWTIILMTLWTWGHTPLWVNIVGTIICGINIVCDVLEALNN